MLQLGLNRKEYSEAVILRSSRVPVYKTLKEKQFPSFTLGASVPLPLKHSASRSMQWFIVFNRPAWRCETRWKLVLEVD